LREGGIFGSEITINTPRAEHLAEMFIMQAEPLITTYLEMRSAGQLRPKRADVRFQVREKMERDWRFNRDLYFRVGEQWDWIDRRPWTADQWKDYATDPELRTFAGSYDEAIAGYYELRRDDQGGIEIAYFGLLPEFIGRGLGGALLTRAIEEAWRTSPMLPRVWVHTCNRDHPQALANYQARGMVVYKVEETAA
jgi:GNAT superfamily N-acetyltransferase